MPRYNYLCKHCAAKAVKNLGRDLTDGELAEFLFETRHSMFPSDEELTKAARCPDCDGDDVEKIIDASGQLTFVRGHDWNEFKRENKGAMRRDMALHQLESDDPYGHMRTQRDKDELTEKLKSGATKKSKPQYFIGTSKRF